MKRLQLFLLLTMYCTVAQSQLLGSVSGVVTNKETGELLNGVTVTMGQAGSTVTNYNGSYTFTNVSPGKKLLVISHVGFQTVETFVHVQAGETVEADITLTTSHHISDEVVVSASKRPEKITDAPASIQVIGQKELNQFAGSNVIELAAYVQGVEFIRSGVNGVSVNARGMNNAFNNKVFQMVDGRNSMNPLSGGLMMGNNISINKEDIERIEILLGPQTALYGPNVHNALFNYITKDPRKYQGTTLAVSAGNQHQFSGRLRHAAVINNKWAYKLTGEHSVGRDFEFYDSVYAGGGPGGVFGPPVAIQERIDFNFRHIRGEAHVFYNIASKADIIISAGGSNNNFINTHTGGRNQFIGISNHFLQGRFVSPRFYATVYNAWADMGKSFSVIGYTRDFWNRTHSTATAGPNARLTPEEAEIFAKRSGNSFKESPHRFNAEAQYNYSLLKQKLFVVAGVSYQEDKPRGFGINLVDSFRKINIKQYGAVLQLEKTLPLNLRFIGAARLDHHSNFGNFVSPKLGLVKAIGEGNFRITWGRAYSMPSILFQYARTGGLFYGNGEGIRYIPNDSSFNDPKSVKITRALVPEQVSTWEVGYKGNVSKKLFIDITYYNGLSKNFFSPSVGVRGRVLSVGSELVTHNPAFAGHVDANGILRNAIFQSIFNFGDVRVYGFDVGTYYEFNKTFNVEIKYSFMDSDIRKGNIENDANKDGVVLADERSLNSPRKRGVAILHFQNLVQGKAFANVAVRYVQEYDFYSGNQISTKVGEGKRGVIAGPGGTPRYDKNFDWGPLGGTTVDVRAGYHINKMIDFTFGVTNLFDSKIREFAGSPYIGRLYSAEVRVHVPNLK